MFLTKNSKKKGQMIHKQKSMKVWLIVPLIPTLAKQFKVSLDFHELRRDSIKPVYPVLRYEMLGFNTDH